MSGPTPGREHPEPGTVDSSKLLRNRHVTMITLGGIIGASLFVGSGNVIRSAGPAALVAYALGGLLVALAMRMLGELASVRPAVGSFMEYAHVSLGDWAGYLVGWLYWYYWVGVIAFEAVVGGSILHLWVTAVPQWAFSVALLLLFMTTNLVSTRSFGEIEYWLASIKVIAIVVFLLVGTLYALGLWKGAHFSVPNLWQHGGFAPNGISPVISGVAVVIFSYFGTEIAVMAAAESEDPTRGIKQAVRTVVWRILLFFVGGVALITIIVPWNELPDPADKPPFTYIFDLFGIPAAGTLMTAVILTAACSVLNSGMYSAGRMIAALGERGLAPAAVSKRSEKTGVPAWGVVSSTLGGYAAVAVNFLAPDSGIFDFIMNSAGLVALFVYGFIAASQLRTRATMTPAEVEALPIKMWFHPWLGLLTIVGIVGIVGAMIASGPSGRTQVWTSLISVAALVVLWPLVKANLRKRHAAWLHDQG